MPATTALLSGGSWGNVKKYCRGNLLKHFKTLDDLMNTHVLVRPFNKPGFVWGGHPRKGIDTPDMLYVSIDGQDWEVKASEVSPLFMPDNINEKHLFEDAPGDTDTFEEAAS